MIYLDGFYAAELLGLDKTQWKYKDLLIFIEEYLL